MQAGSPFTNSRIVAPANLWVDKTDVWIVNGNLDAVGAYAGLIHKFVADGGGVVMGSKAWNWDGAVLDHPTNLVLRVSWQCSVIY